MTLKMMNIINWGSHFHLSKVKICQLKGRKRSNQVDSHVI